MAKMFGAPDFNPFAAGAKVYGGVRYNPTMGPVDKTGYAERDRKLQVKLKAKRKGAYASSDAMRFS